MAFRAELYLFVVVCLLSTGCSSSPAERKSVTFPAGDKIPVEKLTYSVVDTQILPGLGEAATPRIPQNRFYVVQLSVLNAGNSDAAIPGMTLVDDSGKTYAELGDGAGVKGWLGVVRKVQSNQMEQGSILFDAPAGHYKLKLTDETDPSDVFVDIPLSFSHEQMQNDAQATSEAVAQPVTPVPTRKK